MPHTAREKSSTGYYHVVPKGIHDQIIFETDEDRRIYLELLRQARDKTSILIHAYALMSNHVHLVLEDERDELSSFMKFVDERYGMHVAEVTGRKGGVFVRPFWSEPIENDTYLLCAVRYVHANPAVAGICPASAYEWSSAKDYLGRSGIAETRMVLDMLGGRDGFIAFSRAANWTAHAFPGSRLKNHLSDAEALVIAQSIVGTKVTELPSAQKYECEQAVATLYARGFPVAQIARISGLGRGYCRNVIAGFVSATKG